MAKAEKRITAPAGSPWARGTAFVDGVYVPIDQANITIIDPGFLHSDVT
ncbi:MAG: hypothetical protein JRI54_08250 [Deltaproteobacteria bacterium]|nr:hypothetical protein [Deltaproteobacteria bacterium]